MANKNFTFELEFVFKCEGNRAEVRTWTQTGTTVNRAVSKLVKDIETGKWEAKGNTIPENHPNDDVRVSDLMLLGATRK